MNIKSKYIERASYIWIYSAVIIFLFGFLKWFIAVPSAAAAVYALFLTFRKENDDTFYVSSKILITGALITIVWMALCGQGGFFQQAMDWQGRNAQLHDLIEYSWPVYYSDGSAFTYYIGHFLLPAVIGKIFGLGAARAALMIYTSVGVYIIWLYMIKILKADTGGKQLFVFALLICFGNMEDIRVIVTNFFVGVFHINSSGIVFDFTPNFGSFSWVFNQVVCAFLVLSVFFDDDTRIENFFVLGVPMLLFSPFMLCAAFVIFAVGTVKELIASKNDIAGFFKRLFSIQNLCVLVLLFPVILIYLSGNVFSEKPDVLKFQFVSYGGRILGYLLFIICEFMLYSFCVYPRFKKNPYFYAANAILALLPFVHMGVFNDIMTRASAVGLYVLMLCVGDFILHEKALKTAAARKIILCLLIVTVVAPYMSNSINALKGMSAEIAEGHYSKKWATDWATYEGISDRLDGVDVQYGYYTFDAKDHFFFKYMAKR